MHSLRRCVCVCICEKSILDDVYVLSLTQNFIVFYILEHTKAPPHFSPNSKRFCSRRCHAQRGSPLTDAYVYAQSTVLPYELTRAYYTQER